MYDVSAFLSVYDDIKPQQNPPQFKNLVRTNDANAFWLHDGGPIHDLVDLKNAFDTMTQEQFSYHLNKEKNDFALWVQVLLQDEDCAEALKRANTRKGASRILFRHLKKYDIDQQSN